MRNKSLIFILVFLCLFFSGIAQKSSVFYLEGGGTGIFETLNYERNSLIIKVNSEGGGAIRYGVGLSPKYIQTTDSTSITRQNGSSIIFVVGCNFFSNWSLTGVNSNFFELGLNATVATKNSVVEKIADYKEKTRLFPSLNIGFRHQPVVSNGIIWRINYCPFFIAPKIHHWIGASIGYVFYSRKGNIKNRPKLN